LTVVIGQLRFAAFGQDVTATLHDDLTWTCPDDVPAIVAAGLNTLYGPPVDSSPSYGRPGLLQLQAAAEDLGGAIVRLAPAGYRGLRLY